MESPRRAPPVGRALRVLLGLALIAYIIPVYFRVPPRVAVGSLLLIFGLIAICSLIHITVARQIIAAGPYLAVALTLGLLIAVYVAGGSGLAILGYGKGELAAITFLGISLVVAGLRAVPGCELMAIPGLFFRKDIDLTCLVFSPLDKLERRLRGKRDA